MSRADRFPIPAGICTVARTQWNILEGPRSIRFNCDSTKCTVTRMQMKLSNRHLTGRRTATMSVQHKQTQSSAYNLPTLLLNIYGAALRQWDQPLFRTVFKRIIHAKHIVESENSPGTSWTRYVSSQSNTAHSWHDVKQTRCHRRSIPTGAYA